MMNKMRSDGHKKSHEPGIALRTAGVFRPHLAGQMGPAHEYLCKKCHRPVDHTPSRPVPDQVVWQRRSLVGRNGQSRVARSDRSVRKDIVKGMGRSLTKGVRLGFFESRH